MDGEQVAHFKPAEDTRMSDKNAEEIKNKMRKLCKSLPTDTLKAVCMKAATDDTQYAATIFDFACDELMVRIDEDEFIEFTVEIDAAIDEADAARRNDD